MNANNTCTVTLTFAQANLTRYALLKHWDLIENDKRCSAEKKAAALNDIDAAIEQIDRFIFNAQQAAS